MNPVAPRISNKIRDLGFSSYLAPLASPQLHAFTLSMPTLESGLQSSLVPTLFSAKRWLRYQPQNQLGFPSLRAAYRVNQHFAVTPIRYGQVTLKQNTLPFEVIVVSEQARRVVNDTAFDDLCTQLRAWAIKADSAIHGTVAQKFHRDYYDIRTFALSETTKNDYTGTIHITPEGKILKMSIQGKNPNSLTRMLCEEGYEGLGLQQGDLRLIIARGVDHVYGLKDSRTVTASFDPDFIPLVPLPFSGTPSLDSDSELSPYVKQLDTTKVQTMSELILQFLAKEGKEPTRLAQDNSNVTGFAAWYIEQVASKPELKTFSNTDLAAIHNLLTHREHYAPRLHDLIFAKGRKAELPHHEHADQTISSELTEALMDWYVALQEVLHLPLPQAVRNDKPKGRRKDQDDEPLDPRGALPPVARSNDPKGDGIKQAAIDATKTGGKGGEKPGNITGMDIKKHWLSTKLDALIADMRADVGNPERTNESGIESINLNHRELFANFLDLSPDEAAFRLQEITYLRRQVEGSRVRCKGSVFYAVSWAKYLELPRKKQTHDWPAAMAQVYENEAYRRQYIQVASKPRAAQVNFIRAHFKDAHGRDVSDHIAGVWLEVFQFLHTKEDEIMAFQQLIAHKLKAKKSRKKS